MHEIGWRAIGIEYSADTVEMLKEKYPFEIIQQGSSLSDRADVLHLADVTEHLTDLDGQFGEILQLLKPGGILLCTAPLENNQNLWQKVLLLFRRIRSNIPDGAPYHVTLATTEGYERLFERHGLETVKFSIEQINFPAPYKIRECTSLKKLCLYLLREISKLLSPARLGNRLFYIGKK